MKDTMEHPVLAFAKKLSEQVGATAEVERFRQAEKQVQDSEKVNQLIEEIKKKQKELVHAKHYHKSEYVRLLEKELEQLHYEFDHLPIVREYQQYQVEVNDLLQTIQHVVAETVSTKIHIEVGGEVARGCGSGGSCGCSSRSK
ncbi:RicAFT regulatory complex protein RicA family protein [Baia soyae]|nr:YlbF family regulator [Baia soyae]